MPTRNTIIALLITLAITFTTTAHATDPIRYVNKSNTNPTQDGLTWQTAFDTIQPAINAAFDSGGGEVWVAKGIYNEERESVFGDPQVNTASIVLKTGISLLGGFDGDENDAFERSIDASLTVIDGATARDGLPALTVVYAFQDSRLDGFTIQGGYAEFTDNWMRGAGVRCEERDFTIENCIVRNNVSVLKGGGLLIDGNYALLKNLHIEDNSTQSGTGGGCSIMAANVVVEGCVFRNNTASGTGGLKIETNNLTTSTVRNCVFDSNEMTGGGFFSAGGAAVTGSVLFENCLFVNNISVGSDNGGALFNGGGRDEFGVYVRSSIVNCTFVGNRGTGGSAIAAADLALNVQNCIFWNNEGQWIGVVGSFTSLFAQMINSVVQEGEIQGEISPTTNILHDNPLFVNPAGGDYRLRPQSVAIDSGVASTEFEFQQGSTHNAPDTDLDSNARPLGDGYDIGAYEFDPEVPFEDPFDATGDSSVNAADIQHLINQVLGTTSPITDINNDGTTNAADIQLIINRVLGMI